MIKRIVYLAIPLLIFSGIGLIAVRDFFSSFPPSKTVIEKLAPSENIPAAIDLTESFFDDSGSMKGYYDERYIKFLRILKSHIRERGQYQYYAFSAPENILKGDVWGAVEDVRFYQQNNTHFDHVLDSILKRVLGGKRIAKNFLIITDGIQDVSKRQDYSRIVNKVSDLLDAGLFFQIAAIKLPFSGRKYPEDGGFITYKGSSPLYCYIFSYQPDFGRDLYKKLSALNLPVKFLEFGSGNINVEVKRYRIAGKNQDGSKNAFKKFKDEIPVTYLVGKSGRDGTLLMDIALSVKGVNLDNSDFSRKTPEFCGKCLPIDHSGNNGQELKMTMPDVSVTAKKVEKSSDAGGSTGIEYLLFFKNRDRESKTIACDLTFCNWLPADPPDWIDDWSSDCDDLKGCYEGKTPFLSSIISPLLSKSMREYTLGYAVIRN